MAACEVSGCPLDGTRIVTDTSRRLPETRRVCREHAAAHEQGRTSMRAKRADDLRRAQASVLMYLRNHLDEAEVLRPGASSAKIADNTGLDVGFVLTALKHLETGGLVSKSGKTRSVRWVAVPQTAVQKVLDLFDRLDGLMDDLHHVDDDGIRDLIESVQIQCAALTTDIEKRQEALKRAKACKTALRRLLVGAR